MSALLLPLKTYPVCAASQRILKKKPPIQGHYLQNVGMQSQVDLIDMKSHEVKGNEMDNAPHRLLLRVFTNIVFLYLTNDTSIR